VTEEEEIDWREKKKTAVTGYGFAQQQDRRFSETTHLPPP
jgi:hypothetical protein